MKGFLAGAQKAFALLLLTITSPLLLSSYVGGWIWGTAKHCFFVGYATSVSGVLDKAEAVRFENLLATIAAASAPRDKDARLQ